MTCYLYYTVSKMKEKRMGYMKDYVMENLTRSVSNNTPRRHGHTRRNLVYMHNRPVTPRRSLSDSTLSGNDSRNTVEIVSHKIQWCIWEVRELTLVKLKSLRINTPHLKYRASLSIIAG